MQQPEHLPREGDRRELNRMLGKLASGDVVTVTRIDRLARSTFDLFGIVKRIVDAKAQFRSLAEPWADTGTSTGRLMLAVLGGLADVERDLIRTRTAEGRSRAKAQGKSMGRPPSLTHRPNRKRPPDAARRARRCRNWPIATTVALPPCAVPRVRHEAFGLCTSISTSQVVSLSRKRRARPSRRWALWRYRPAISPRFGSDIDACGFIGRRRTGRLRGGF